MAHEGPPLGNISSVCGRAGGGGLQTGSVRDQDRERDGVLADLSPGIPGGADTFIGRDHEIEELAATLAGSRLTVLTGPSGVGKTRLAREVAARLDGRYPDGIRQVELAALTEPALVVSAVATACSVWEQPGRRLLDTLVTRLAGRRALLVLDNCEHLLQACAELADTLLRACPEVSVLATSQAPLDVAGERVWPVPPLSVSDSPPAAGEPGGSEAVMLFCARATAVKPDFAPTAETLAVVAEICRRLDGIPLAIELAAARITVLSVAQIAARLNQRLAVLTGGSRAVQPRHQTLRAAIDWSHELLSEDEQVLLRRMSVFVGGFTLNAVETVCRQGDGDRSTLPALSGLVSRSLVSANTAGPEARYSLLETIRIYGAERLVAAGEAAALRQAHARWCLELAEEAEPALTGEHQSVWLERLATEHDNFRAALTWFLEAGELAQALQLGGALTLFWRVRGHFQEGRTWLETALARLETRAGPVTARALWGLGFLALMLNDDAAALKALEQSLALARADGDRRLEARSLLLLGNRLMFREPQPAEVLLVESAELARTAEDTWCLAHALALVAHVHVDLGDPAAARRDLDECLRAARLARNQQSLKIGLLVAGDTAMILGDHDDAGRLLQEGLAVAEQLDEPYTIANVMARLGELAVLQGRHEQAHARLAGALTIARDSGNPALVADTLGFLGGLAHAEGDLTLARARFNEARAVGEETGRLFWAVLRGAAEVARAAGEWGEARALLDEALAAVEGGKQKRGRAATLASLGNLARCQGDFQEARSLHRSSLELWHEMGEVPGVADGLEDLAGLAADAGKFDRAVRLLAAASALRDARGFLRSPTREPGYAADLAAVRRGIGSAEFEAAWSEGSALPAAEVVPYAIKGAAARGRAISGWGRLTPAELEISKLVGEGLTNREIGLRLFISPRTVETHLTRVFASLGVASRRDLAREVVRRRGFGAATTSGRGGDPS